MPPGLPSNRTAAVSPSTSRSVLAPQTCCGWSSTQPRSVRPCSEAWLRGARRAQSPGEFSPPSCVGKSGRRKTDAPQSSFGVHALACSDGAGTLTGRHPTSGYWAGSGCGVSLTGFIRGSDASFTVQPPVNFAMFGQCARRLLRRWVWWRLDVARGLSRHWGKHRTELG